MVIKAPSVARPIPSLADAFTQPKPALVILDLDTTYGGFFSGGPVS